VIRGRLKMFAYLNKGVVKNGYRKGIKKAGQKMSEELKTLKDFKLIEYDEGGVWNFVGDLKSEAIKWVKEDIEEFDIDLKQDGDDADILNKKWMKRLDITEEDLKNG